MKNLLIALVVLASGSVFGKDIASYRFAIREGDWNQSTIKVIEATLTDEEELIVEVDQFPGNGQFIGLLPDGPRPTYLREKQLSKHTFQSLKWNVVALSTAEIEERFSDIVCAMMPGPLQTNDHLTVAREWDHSAQDFLAPMQLVMGPNGCWNAHSIFPKGGRHQQAANLLKNQLKVLALEMI